MWLKTLIIKHQGTIVTLSCLILNGLLCTSTTSLPITQELIKGCISYVLLQIMPKNIHYLPNFVSNFFTKCQDRLQSGKTFLDHGLRVLATLGMSHTLLNPKYCIRLCIIIIYHKSILKAACKLSSLPSPTAHQFLPAKPANQHANASLPRQGLNQLKTLSNTQTTLV